MIRKVANKTTIAIHLFLDMAFKEIVVTVINSKKINIDKYARNILPIELPSLSQSRSVKTKWSPALTIKVIATVKTAEINLAPIIFLGLIPALIGKIHCFKFLDTAFEDSEKILNYLEQSK